MTAYGALGVLLLLILLPGFGVSFALYRPGELSIPTRLALALSSGYGVSALISYFLILTGLFYAVPAFALVGAATIAAWAVAWRRAPLLRHLRSIRLVDARNDVSAVLGMLVIAAIAVLAHGSITTFRARIPYRYWVDGMQNARLHEIPGSSIHYGELYPTIGSKVLLDAFTAFVTGAISQPQLAVGPLLWVATVGTAVALLAFAREAGLRATAPLIPIVAVVNPLSLGSELTRDLDAYRAEPVGRLLAFTALAFGVRAVRGSGRRDALVAAFLLVASSGTHLVPTLMVCLLLGGFALGRILANRSRAAIRATVLAIALVGSGALLGGLLILAGPASTGLGGPSKEARYGGYPAGFDPTSYLQSGASNFHPDTAEWYRTPRKVVGIFLAQSLGDAGLAGLGALTLFALILGTLAAAVFVALRADAPMRDVPLACWIGAVLSILIALYFSHSYRIYELATFGIRRLFDYGPLLFILSGAAVIEILVGGLRRFRAWAPAALALLVAAVIVWPFVTYAQKSRADDSEAIPLLSWVRVNTPCDARLLANTRTVGVFQALTGRISVTEGMGPFLRPVMLRRVVGLLMDARRFFRDPSAQRAFLADHAVDYVVIVRKLEIGHRNVIGEVNEQAFETAPFLQRVEAAPDYTIYRVLDEPDAPHQLPQRFPCATTPLT